MAKRCVKNFPPTAEKLSKSFWPGPLTLVLPRSEKIPDIVTAGGETVGIRWPGHPFIQAVIRECGFPLAAPSANLSNNISPTNAEHVREQLGGKIPLIVDGGQSQVGIESTVLDLTVSPPQILRPGMVHAESLAAVCGEVQSPASKIRRNGSESGPVEKTLFAEGKIAGFELARRRGFEITNRKSQITNSKLPRHHTHESSFGRKFFWRERDSARRGGVCAGALRGVAPLRRGGREMDCRGSAAGFAGMVGHRGPVASRGGMNFRELIARRSSGHGRRGTVVRGKIRRAPWSVGICPAPVCRSRLGAENCPNCGRFLPSIRRRTCHPWSAA